MDHVKLWICITTFGSLCNIGSVYVFAVNELYRHSAFTFLFCLLIVESLILTLLSLLDIGEMVGIRIMHIHGYCQMVGTVGVFLYANLLLFHYADLINPIRVLLFHKKPLDLIERFYVVLLSLFLSTCYAVAPFVLGGDYAQANHGLFCYFHYGSNMPSHKLQMIIASIILSGFPCIYSYVYWFIFRDVKQMPRNRRNERLLDRVQWRVLKRGFIITGIFYLCWILPTYHFVTQIYKAEEIPFLPGYIHAISCIFSGIFTPFALAYADGRYRKLIVEIFNPK